MFSCLTYPYMTLENEFVLCTYWSHYIHYQLYLHDYNRWKMDPFCDTFYEKIR